MSYDPIIQLSFKQLIQHYTLWESEILEFIECDKRTFNGWLKNNTAPIWARKIVAIIGRGYLPPTVTWEGFSIRDDVLYTPFKRFELSTGRILSFWYTLQQIDILKSENKKLNRHIEQFKHITIASNSLFDDDGQIKQLKLL